MLSPLKGRTFASLGIVRGTAAVADDAALAASRVSRAALPVRTNAQLIDDIGSAARDWAVRKGLTGTARELGTAKHAYARDVLRRYQRMFGDRGLVAETSYLRGVPVPYGTKGSVRLDVLDLNTRAVWDYKFGTTPMSAAQQARIMANGPGVTSITPVMKP